MKDLRDLTHLAVHVDNFLIDSGLGEGYHESKRCSRDTHPESYITKQTSIRSSPVAHGDRICTNSDNVKQLTQCVCVREREQQNGFWGLGRVFGVEGSGSRVYGFGLGVKS